MSVTRLEYITKIGVEQMGDLANSLDDEAVLRLENLDSDLRPPSSALESGGEVGRFGCVWTKSRSKVNTSPLLTGNGSPGLLTAYAISTC